MFIHKITVKFGKFYLGDYGKFLKEEKELRGLLQEFDDNVRKVESQETDGDIFEQDFEKINICYKN